MTSKNMGQVGPSLAITPPPLDHELCECGGNPIFISIDTETWSAACPKESCPFKPVVTADSYSKVVKDWDRIMGSARSYKEDFNPRELQFAKFIRWLLNKVYGQEFVIVTKVQWDAIQQNEMGENDERRKRLNSCR